MTNTDIQGAAASFTTVANDAKTLQAQLDALGAQKISNAQEAALQALAALATSGESLLASGASKARDDEIQAITNKIHGLETAIAFGGDQDALNAEIANLTAKRAGLLMQKVGDYSGVVAPAKVQQLIGLAVKVHDAAEQKKTAAEIVGLVQQVASTAIDVAGTIAAFV